MQTLVKCQGVCLTALLAHWQLLGSLSHPYQLMFFAAGLAFLFGQFAHLLFDVADLSLQTFVLFLLTVLTAAALVPFLCQFLQVLLKASYEALHRGSTAVSEWYNNRGWHVFENKVVSYNDMNRSIHLYRTPQKCKVLMSLFALEQYSRLSSYTRV